MRLPFNLGCHFDPFIHIFELTLQPRGLTHIKLRATLDSAALGAAATTLDSALRSILSEKVKTE